ncbi:carboxymuconolactone decarboxylase family protein [Ideonella azotifigens]|uniref:Carboxymuconolactone decarboxylase family protein n=1 Tax=Ideonella azotifigens TaxID=513160 RepID=A0ABN1KL06_9BURK|nr:carboxymuconolactone decarboxylase family protein [Ideonella azotifigens]MCD2339148.1 carboxymuconolactone decarboxylase family protein [Ideonella azotifigens]
MSTSSQDSHGPRIDWAGFETHAPEVIKALRALGQAVDEGGLDKSLTELLKVRASQLNGCAFCLQFHLNLARKLGVPAPKLDLAATWREAGSVYTARERAALQWTEALTLMADRPIADAAYGELQAQFSEKEIALLTTSIGAINAWNRIAGSLQFTPPIPKAVA